MNKQVFVRMSMQEVTEIVRGIKTKFKKLIKNTFPDLNFAENITKEIYLDMLSKKSEEVLEYCVRVEKEPAYNENGRIEVLDLKYITIKPRKDYSVEPIKLLLPYCDSNGTLVNNNILTVIRLDKENPDEKLQKILNYAHDNYFPIPFNKYSGYSGKRRISYILPDSFVDKIIEFNKELEEIVTPLQKQEEKLVNLVKSCTTTKQLEAIFGMELRSYYPKSLDTKIRIKEEKLAEEDHEEKSEVEIALTSLISSDLLND